MTGHICRDVILEQHVCLFRGAMAAEFLCMDDNAHPHRANIVGECVQSEDITRMNWPAYSPDLNPIVRVWDILGRRIAARQPPPTCLPEFRRALLDEWCNIPQDQIDNLILGMPRRCGGQLDGWKWDCRRDGIVGLYQSEDSVSRRPVPGRPRATTPAEDRFLALSARRRRTTTVPQLVADHFQASGRRISATTV
ncbi:transposable element Tcb1 transposase [Trichonephila clavipes]|nr:transposable element Tcb1 transposase [Trichonephila clavipes]